MQQWVHKLDMKWVMHLIRKVIVEKLSMYPGEKLLQVKIVFQEKGTTGKENINHGYRINQIKNTKSRNNVSNNHMENCSSVTSKDL